MLQLQILNVNHGTFINDDKSEIQFVTLSAYDPSIQFSAASNPHPSMPGYQGFDVVKYRVAKADALAGFNGAGLYDCGFYMGKKSGIATPVITSLKKVR